MHFRGQAVGFLGHLQPALNITVEWDDRNRSGDRAPNGCPSVDRVGRCRRCRCWWQRPGAGRPRRLPGRRWAPKEPAIRASWRQTLSQTITRQVSPEASALPSGEKMTRLKAPAGADCGRRDYRLAEPPSPAADWNVGQAAKEPAASQPTASEQQTATRTTRTSKPFIQLHPSLLQLRYQNVSTTWQAHADYVTFRQFT